MYQIYVYIYVENFRSFAHLLHTPVRRLMKSVYDNSVGATAMCSLRCAHTPPLPCYVLTALRAYARLMGLRLCAHCVARIRTAIRCDLDRLRLSLRNYANGIIISRSTIPTEPRWSFRRVSPGNTGVNEPPFQKSPAPTVRYPCFGKHRQLILE